MHASPDESASRQHREAPPEKSNGDPRRRFFQSAVAAVIGGLVALVPIVSGMVVFLDPLRRRSKSRKMLVDPTIHCCFTAAWDSVKPT